MFGERHPCTASDEQGLRIRERYDLAQRGAVRWTLVMKPVDPDCSQPDRLRSVDVGADAVTEHHSVL